MPRVSSKYAEAAQAIRGAAAKALVRAAESHVSVAKQLAPVDTGFLRDNIGIEGATVDESAGRFREVSSGRFSAPTDLTVVSNAPYSSYVEFGTVNSEAQPFFVPAFESARRQLQAEIKAAVDEELRSVKV